MSTDIVLPKLGFAMAEGTLTTWLVPDGSTVTEGSPLYTIEAEKAVEEIEAPASGTLRISAQAGGTYPVGTVLGLIE